MDKMDRVVHIAEYRKRKDITIGCSECGVTLSLSIPINDLHFYMEGRKWICNCCGNVVEVIERD